MTTAEAPARKRGNKQTMEQRPQSGPAEVTPKHPEDGMPGVFHSGEGHGPPGPVRRGQTPRDRLREHLSLSPEVTDWQLMDDAANLIGRLKADADGLRESRTA